MGLSGNRSPLYLLLSLHVRITHWLYIRLCERTLVMFSCIVATMAFIQAEL